MKKQTSGSFLFILHSHIPYVLSHGRWPHGSDWLLEVTAETYIPLLNMLNRLVDEGISPKITISITPVLAEQLADESFKYEFAAYARMRAKAATENKREFKRLKDEPMAHLAELWHEYYAGIVSDFKKKYKRSILKNFADLQDAGHIEVMTSSATHAYSPLLSQDESIKAQVKQGVQTYKRHFGREPSGYWLPECAYRPSYVWSPPVQPKGSHIEPYLRKGVDEFLRENGLKYFVVESHLLHGGETKGVYIDRYGALQDIWKQFPEAKSSGDITKTPYGFYLVESGEKSASPLFIFVRDYVTGSQVWSRQEGYPGDEWYLEFHKKYHKGGLRFWRVTGPKTDLGDKVIYQPDIAAERVSSHADHFVGVAKGVLKDHLNKSGKQGLICAPYDTELYGHWWFEGIDWLYTTLKRMHNDPEISVMTCSEVLQSGSPTASISLPEGSWGEGGFHYMWLNEQTEWTWVHVYQAELEMKDLVHKFGENVEALPVLKQAARELLLLQASDWQFSISTGTSKDYAESRLTEHFKSFERLAGIVHKIASGEQIPETDWNFYKVCEEREPLFQDVDVRWFV